MQTMVMNTQTARAYAGHQPESTRLPATGVRIDGDEFLSRVRNARLLLRHGVETTKKIVRMWYL